MSFGDAGDAFICHHCDNPACVRPDHLFKGDHVENMRDMANKGRGNFTSGERHQNAKISDAQVEEIRARRNKGEDAQSIALDYGISPSNVSAIALNKRRQASHGSVKH
jgi:hypothetical protein